MNTTPYHFDEVTLLITHYNRSASLERLLKAFRELNCTFGGIVVSDDGSKPEHQAHIAAIQPVYRFTLAGTPRNRGLGNNINKGQDAVRTPYTLYIQEDFVPKPGFPQHFADALQIMQQDQGIDTIRFYAYFRYPYMKPYGKGFSEMTFKKALWYTNHLKFYAYSDHPHLRRSSFFNRFGRYAEGVSVDVTELQMALAYLKNKGRGLLYEDFTGIIDQANSSNEPSTVDRRKWVEKKNPGVRLLRQLYLKYRMVKNTIQLMNFKQPVSGKL